MRLDTFLVKIIHFAKKLCSQKTATAEKPTISVYNNCYLKLLS